jgi:hypothetical protein
VSTDGLTGAQARERKHPGLPRAPGQGERREFAYLRHGTASFILSRAVVTGLLVAPWCGAPRAAADFLAHLQGVVGTDLAVARWHFVVDNLTIHGSEALVRSAAAAADRDLDLGEKGTSGILHTCRSRAAFRSDPSHRVVFHYTPKHSSWLNQIAIWLSILVRKLLQRGSFTSVDDLRERVLAFIASDNRTRAKPFKWTYQGKALVA